MVSLTDLVSICGAPITIDMSPSSCSSRSSGLCSTYSSCPKLSMACSSSVAASPPAALDCSELRTSTGVLDAPEPKIRDVDDDGLDFLDLTEDELEAFAKELAGV